LSILQVAREVKKAIGKIKETAAPLGIDLDPVVERGGLREEIGHYLPLASFSPPISVEGHLSVTDQGLWEAGVVLEYDHTEVPDEVRLQSATAPLRDRRMPRPMSDLDQAEFDRVKNIKL